MAYSHVLVGTDGSETAAEAVRHAAQLAAACGARLTIVTAFSPDPDRTARAQADAPLELQWQITDSAVATERAEEARRVARQEGAGEVAIHVEAGDPADVVVAAAELRGAEVIVVGSKGMNNPTRFLLGSVPNKISHHAPCDVIIVHTVP